MTRILICGGRDLSSSDVFNWLERYLRDEVEELLGYKAWPPTAIIHGGARGADEGAGDWAESEGIKPTVFKVSRYYGANSPFMVMTELFHSPCSSVVAPEGV
jgi:hypothetical protein